MSRVLIVCAVLLAPLCTCCPTKQARSAPVPKAKPIIRPSVPGAYVMVFHGVDYPTLLLEGGGYAAEGFHDPEDGGRPLRWEGTWELKGDTFTIKERLVPSDYYDMITFKFTLKKGKLESECGGLKLKKVR